VVESTERRIRRVGVRSADAVRHHPHALVGYSPERRRQNIELRKYLYKHLYFNPVVQEPNLRAVRLLEQLFHYYLDHPQQLGALSRKRIQQDGIHRAVCDYLSGMTDRYAILEHQRLFGLNFPDMRRAPD